MRSILPLIILSAASLCAQARITFSPREYRRGAVWTIAACAPPGTVAVAVPAGRVYQILVEHGIAHDGYDQALIDIDSTEARSKPASIVRWGGYLVAGAAFLMTVDAIKIKPNERIAASASAGALNVIIALAQSARHTAEVDAVKRHLLRDTDILMGNTNACGIGVVIGGRGAAFEVVEAR